MKIINDIEKIEGTLEIDYLRGVVYFTPAEGEMQGATLLRIQGFSTPIKKCRMMDIRINASYGEEVTYD